MEKNQALLQCEQVTVDFDGFLAVQELNFEMEKKELHFLIGPNGAGKTTLLDAICGKVRLSQGRISILENIELQQLQEFQIAQKGVGRKFQAPSIFSKLSVFENLEISMKQKTSLWSLITAVLSKKEKDRIDDILRLIGLQDHRYLEAGTLSHGQKQWLEIGMVLMQEPSLFLLDEPIAGMTEEEKEKTGDLLKKITHLSSVLVVEHDMDFVRSFAHKVTVMHEGRVLCAGDMEEVQQNPKVIEVYLGRKDESHVAATSA